MQFEIWACSGSPREEGCPPLQEALVYTANRTWNAPPSLVTSAPHTISPAEDWVRRALSLCRGVWSPVHWGHPPACTKITLNRVTSEKHTVVPNNILSSSLDRFEPQVQRLWGKLGPVWTGLKLFSCCTWILRYLPTGKHFPRVFRLVAHFVHFWSWA